MPLFETVTDIRAQREVIRRRRYGVIEVARGRLVRVLLRPWPKLSPIGDLLWNARQPTGDCCRLYYNQPQRWPNFIALRYVCSSLDGTLASLQLALAVLDEIARIKGTDALLCDVFNPRITHRLMVRWGWEPHTSQRWHRNYIKRFYSQYDQHRRGTAISAEAASWPRTNDPLLSWSTGAENHVKQAEESLPI
jgi:hypothetical protein